MFLGKRYYCDCRCFSGKSSPSGKRVFTHKSLPLLIVYPPRLLKSDCNPFALSLTTRAGSTTLAQTTSLCVIQFIASKIGRASFWNHTTEKWFERNKFGPFVQQLFKSTTHSGHSQHTFVKSIFATNSIILL